MLKYIKIKPIPITIVFNLIFMGILSADDFNIDNLLQNIEKKTDLSEQTKLENGGVSYIYTREDIRKMQAHNLKDILKSTYPFGYNENSFGIADPYTLNPSIPYMSSSIKIYIDEQEITTGLYGSGLSIYGNMDIDFVDHIEVYSGNPTFEFSTEPAFTVIKLYSKIAQKDEGSKVAVTGGSNSTKGVMFYDTNTLDNGWSYFSYVNILDNNRKEYDSYNTTISRDTDSVHLFNSFYKGEDKILIDAILTNRDSFMDHSVFGTPKDATIDNNYIHIGYNGKKGNLSYLVSFDKYDTITDFEDENKDSVETLTTITGGIIPYSIESDSASEVYTTGLDYSFDTDRNQLLFGVKYRLKHFTFDTLDMNGEPIPQSERTKQTTSTVFLENQYLPATNQIITTGVSYIEVRNDYSDQDDDLYNVRIGYTYLTKNLVSKTIASYLEFAIDPYLVNSMYLSDPTKKVPKSKQNIYMQNVKYTQGSNEYEGIISYITITDALMPNVDTGKLEAYSKSLDISSCALKYTKEYMQFNKLELTAGLNKVENIPGSSDVYYEYSTTIRNLHSYNQFDIFNEFLLYENNDKHRVACDYSAGVTYHKSEDLTISLKGTNLLDKAKDTEYVRVDPQTFTVDDSLRISPIDQKIMLTVEYTF